MNENGFRQSKPFMLRIPKKIRTNFVLRGEFSSVLEKGLMIEIIFGDLFPPRTGT